MCLTACFAHLAILCSSQSLSSASTHCIQHELACSLTLTCTNSQNKRECFQKLIRYMTQGIDMSAAFVPATKCVALSKQDLPLKKMLYLYLRTAAKQNPAVALLVVQVCVLPALQTVCGVVWRHKIGLWWALQCSHCQPDVQPQPCCRGPTCFPIAIGPAADVAERLQGLGPHNPGAGGTIHVQPASAGAHGKCGEWCCVCTA